MASCGEIAFFVSLLKREDIPDQHVVSSVLDVCEQAASHRSEKRSCISCRYKGLHLLCVGKLAGDSEIAEGIAEFDRRGMVRVIDRHVDQAEEEESFAACDALFRWHMWIILVQAGFCLELLGPVRL